MRVHSLKVAVAPPSLSIHLAQRQLLDPAMGDKLPKDMAGTVAVTSSWSSGKQVCDAAISAAQQLYEAHLFQVFVNG